MIDPTNTEPIPVHRPTMKHVLSLLAIFALVLSAVLVLLKQDFFAKPQSVVEQANPLPYSSLKTEFTAIQDKVTRGEMTQEDAERAVRELIGRTPTPTPPTN